MSKKLIAVFLIFSMLLVGCSSNINSVDKDEQKVRETPLNIITTNKLLYYSVLYLTKEKHRVSYMFSDSSKINDFDFSSDSIDNISKMDLFIYEGAQMEPWIDDFTLKVSKGGCGIINSSRGTKIIQYDKSKKVNSYDISDNPYYFLNIDNYKVMLQNIKNSLEDKDPSNREFYEDNFSSTLKKLSSYEKKYEDIGKKYKDETIVSGDEDIAYLEKYLNFDYIPVEKSKKDMETKLKGAKNIYYLYSSDKSKERDEELITKYNMKPIKICIMNDKSDIFKIYDINIDILTKSINS